MRVTATRDTGQRVGFLATLENFEFTPADAPARVVVNSRTGTIVIGRDVRLLPAAITHGGLTVTISENQQVSQRSEERRVGHEGCGTSGSSGGRGR